MSAQAIWSLLKTTFTDWNEDKAPRLAAALAYYAVFAIAPILIIAISIASLFFEGAQDQIIAQINTTIGPQAGEAIRTMIQNRESTTTDTLATLVGIVTLVVAASGLFGQLQDALNTIWEVQPKPGQGIWAIIKSRFLSFTMVLGVGFLLLISLVISAALAALGTTLAGPPESQTIVWQVINALISFGVTMLLFALIFKVLPDAKVSWNDVWIGAAATALLFSLGRFLISQYLATESTASTYGAAGALVLLLIWVYYSAQILFLGAEFTQVYARIYGSKIQPAENAVAMTEEARAQEGIPRQEQVEAADHTQGQAGETSASRAGPHAQKGVDTAEPSRLAGVGALAAFFVGVLLGRRQRSRQPEHQRAQQ